jgi:hypothetical protein
MRISHLTESSSDLRDWMEDNGWSYDSAGWLVHPRLPQLLSPSGLKYMGDVYCSGISDVDFCDFCNLHEMSALRRYLVAYPKLLTFASEAVQLAAVQRDGYSIQWIRNPSEAVQLAAVRQDGNAIQCIMDPSEQVQLAAVRQNHNVIQYIRSPSEAVRRAASEQTDT